MGKEMRLEVGNGFWGSSKDLCSITISDRNSDGAAVLTCKLWMFQLGVLRFIYVPATGTHAHAGKRGGGDGGGGRGGQV